MAIREVAPRAFPAPCCRLAPCSFPQPSTPEDTTRPHTQVTATRVRGGWGGQSSAQGGGAAYRVSGRGVWRQDGHGSTTSTRTQAQPRGTSLVAGRLINMP